MTKELQPLDILLYKGKGFTSWLIEVGTSSHYSHVALVVDPKINLGIESNMGHQSGVKAFDLRKLEMGEVDVYRIKPDFLTKVQKDSAISFLVNHLGAGYDTLGVIGLGLLKIISFITGGWTRKWNKKISAIPEGATLQDKINDEITSTGKFGAILKGYTQLE